MTDKLTTEQRSENMRRIRAVNTTPELAVRRVVHGMGFRYRLHVKALPGHPDIVLTRLRKIILVHGCFWHSHDGCIETHVPKTRHEYWRPKLEGNRLRDLKNLKNLKRLGWKVLVVWECQTCRKQALVKRLNHFLSS